MTLRYRTAGPWGPGIGADLDPAHVDQNFYTIDTRVQAVEALPPPAPHIDHFTIVGDQLTVHMSDGSTLGPYKLPVVPLVFRGTWQPSTAYHSGEMFSHGSSIYQVLVNHTSDTTFDAGENDGAGHDYYGFGLTLEGGLPAGGSAGMWLKKATSADFAVTWTVSPLPTGGTSGQFLRKVSNLDDDNGWSDFVLSDAADVDDVDANFGSILRSDGNQYNKQQDYPPNSVALTAITLGETHLYKFNMVGSGGSTCTITVPAETGWSGALFPGAMAHFRQAATDQIVFTGGSGVTIEGIAGCTNATNKQGAVATLYYAGSNVWYLYGLLAA